MFSIIFSFIWQSHDYELQKQGEWLQRSAHTCRKDMFTFGDVIAPNCRLLHAAFGLHRYECVAATRPYLPKKLNVLEGGEKITSVAYA